MNICGINSRIFALALVVVAGNVMGSENDKQKQAKFDFQDLRGTAYRMGESSLRATPGYVFVSLVNKHVPVIKDSPLAQSTIATGAHTLPALKCLYDKEKVQEKGLELLVGAAGYEAGNYATRRVVDAVSDRVGGLDGIAKKCPESIFGYDISKNFTPAVKGMVKDVAPLVREAVCDNGAQLEMFIAGKALQFVVGYFAGGSGSTKTD